MRMNAVLRAYYEAQKAQGDGQHGPLNGEKLMQEQETLIERRDRKRDMIQAFRWYSGRGNAHLFSEERLEKATALLLEQGCIERIEPRPQEPKKDYRLTSKGEALSPKVNETFGKILSWHGECGPSGSHPLDEATYFN
jgi:hypothetical protein